MVKLWLIIGLTVFVGIVTAILGLMNEARFVVILGRMLGAMLFVGILTYLLIFFFQTTYLKVIKIFIEANDTPKTDKTIDAEQAIEGEDLSSEQNQPEQATFEPFTPDNFTKVSPPTE